MLTEELCSLVGMRTQRIQGFARSLEHKVGKIFKADRDHLHSWLAVFLFGSWRFLDPTWGAGFMDDQGRFHPCFEEHYFLTDPKDLSQTHHPYHETEEEYERWQLVDKPITLEEFNLIPKITPAFFHLKMRLRKPKENPVVFRHQTDIQVSSSFLLRYKYCFYESEGDGTEENQWVFCQLREGGVVGSFTVIAPRTGSFILKIYATIDNKPEEREEVMPLVICFVLSCTKARKYPVPWPIHDGVWGPTPRLYESGLSPVNQNSPLVIAWGGKKLLTFDKIQDVLLMCQFYDVHGTLLDSKSVMRREENDEQIRIMVLPPGIGYFKMLIFGMARPQIRGRWKLPLLAAYLIECKMANTISSDKKNEERKEPSRKIRVMRR